MSKKRIRMFAGPNGSGKSTVYETLKNQFDIGIYVNADEIEKILKKENKIDLDNFGITQKILENEFGYFIINHNLSKKSILNNLKIDFKITNNVIYNLSDSSHSYQAAILADFIRNELIKIDAKFTFETVMSHPSKIEFLEKSKKLGYKNYLYFISTESFEINKQRVGERVKNGGHPVPPNKIENRYYKSLSYLKDIIQFTHRTFIFDNSGKKARLILDVFEGDTITLRSNLIPQWVDKNLLKKYE